MNTATQTAPAEQVTMSVKLMESLLKLEGDAAFERGVIEGMNRVTSLSFDDDDNSTRASLHFITAKSRRALSLEIKNRNHRRSGDNPGQAYLWTCELLRAYRCGNRWQGVCVSRVYYDV